MQLHVILGGTQEGHYYLKDKRPFGESPKLNSFCMADLTPAAINIKGPTSDHCRVFGVPAECCKSKGYQAFHPEVMSGPKDICFVGCQACVYLHT